LRKVLAEVGILLATERAERRRGARQQIEIALSSLKRIFGLGETLATTLVGLATRIAAKIAAYTYAFLISRMMVVLKVVSRSCGHEPDNTHLEIKSLSQ
jgi:transposase